MMVTPPFVVKRDGTLYRIDGISNDTLFMTCLRKKGYVLDVTTGLLICQNYHPARLLTSTCLPEQEKSRLLPVVGSSLRGHLDLSDALRVYESKLEELNKIDFPKAIVPSRFLPILGGFVKGVDGVKMFQGIKTAFGFEIPKVTVNYLTGGYHMQYSLEELVLRVMDHAGLKVLPDGR